MNDFYNAILSFYERTDRPIPVDIAARLEAAGYLIPNRPLTTTTTTISEEQE